MFACKYRLAIATSSVVLNVCFHFTWVVAKLIEVYLLGSNILKRQFPMYHPWDTDGQKYFDTDGQKYLDTDGQKYFVVNRTMIECYLDIRLLFGLI